MLTWKKIIKRRRWRCLISGYCSRIFCQMAQSSCWVFNLNLCTNKNGTVSAVPHSSCALKFQFLALQMICQWQKLTSKKTPWESKKGEKNLRWVVDSKFLSAETHLGEGHGNDANSQKKRTSNQKTRGTSWKLRNWTYGRKDEPFCLENAGGSDSATWVLSYQLLFLELPISKCLWPHAQITHNSEVSSLAYPQLPEPPPPHQQCLTTVVPYTSLSLLSFSDSKVWKKSLCGSREEIMNRMPLHRTEIERLIQGQKNRQTSKPTNNMTKNKRDARKRWKISTYKNGEAPKIMPRN